VAELHSIAETPALLQFKPATDPAHDELLTVAEVASELRCSKAHVHNAINGKVAGVSLLPAIHMGRRKLIRRSALERWKQLNEKSTIDGMIAASPGIDAVRPMGGGTHES
jgi:excisionase family DNA binding protein